MSLSARADPHPGAPAGSATHRRALTGWGRSTTSSADVLAPVTADEVIAVTARAGPCGLLARGLGRSYGDAAQNAGGLVVDATRLAGVRGVDLERGVVTAGAGTSLGDLMELLVPRGWMPPVLPGTRHVTLGGAMAADIHGKNHHVDGSFSRHVEEVELVTPGGPVTARAGQDLFAATAGGMGLTGIMTAMTLRLLPVETSWIRAETQRTSDLDGLLDLMERGDRHHRYSVAWVDCLTRRGRGRGVLTRGDHATVDELPAGERRRPRAVGWPAPVSAPRWVPGGLLNTLTGAAFNEAWFRLASPRPRREVVPLHRFFHPLDGVSGWNRLYGPRGFLQYQFVVPPDAAGVVRRVVEQLVGGPVPVLLAVLKRFGKGGSGPLSFPLAGWTLAVDLPVGDARLAPLLDRFDRWVAGAGGRVYLAKDARLRPEVLRAMYPRLAEWRAVRERVDPHRRLRSDLACRLDLV